MRVKHFRSGRKEALLHKIDHALHRFTFVNRIGHHAFHAGGQADRIVLWPLGGIAYVSPPFRPGAQLWSIVAGPLVNVVLVPVLLFVSTLMVASGVPQEYPDLWNWVRMTRLINFVLLVFNVLPIYPLDGGQILRSLLWFRLGPRRSLLIATSVGLVGVAGLLALAVWWQSIWTGLMVLFLGSNCWRAFQAARQAGAVDRR